MREWSPARAGAGDHYWPGGAGATAASPAPVSASSRLAIPAHCAVGSLGSSAS